MNKTIKIATVSILAVLLQSCSFGYDIQQKFTPLDTTAEPIVCETPPADVDLIFEGEKLDFEYEKIGVIEIQGEQNSNDKEMLEKVKQMSRSKCCDAIINLKRTYTNRTSGLLFKNEYDHDYSAITYHGIAVRKKVLKP